MVKKIVDDSLVSLQGVLKNNEMLQEYNEIVKSFKIIKLKHFTNTILNPSTIAELVLKLGTLKK